jgi:SRSO17 transposase
VKKGTATAGVQRQYTGTAGRTENAQVAVYLAYVAPAGHALIDRELYLPRSWTAGPGRCRAAGIPEGTAFATKPALARRMLARTLDARVPAAWVAADEVYGTDPTLRGDLEENFQASKGLTGLDEHQVRTWTSWHRWVTLAMLALTFLTVAAATEHASRPPPPGQIPLTRNEIARLFTLITQPPATPGTCCTGPTGDAATSTGLKPATTSAKPPKTRDRHDLA